MPSLAIHFVSNIILIAGIYAYERFIRKKEHFNLKYVSILVFASNLIDIDHLLANPIYDPNRCGINFHPLHSWYVFPFYILGGIFGKYKYLFWGIGMHLILDLIDCFI